MQPENPIHECTAKLFISACASVAQADGRIDPSEVTAVIEGLKKAGISLNEKETQKILQTPCNAEALDLDVLESPEEKEALIAIMLLVAQSDGEYSIEEQDLISKVQVQLDISDERMLELATTIQKERAAIEKTLT